LSTPESPGLRENDIRPDHLMKEQAARFAADVAWLLRHRDRFVAACCPACGADEPAMAFEKYGLSYQRCRHCDTVYISPRPAPDVLKQYYETSQNYQYWNRCIFPASEGARRERIFRPRAERLVELCRRHGITEGVLLEVGAGFGTFCEEVQKTGAFRRVIAVEPTPELAQTCRSKGLEVIDRPIEEARLPGERIDVVASFEVLEHLYSPRAFIASCREMLAPGGLLLLTCPNVNGFDVVVLGSQSSVVDVEHLNYFHPDSLSGLLNVCGFEVLEVLTPGQLDAELVRKKALAGEIDLGAQPFLKQVLLDEWDRLGGVFQRFLAENRLSSHMWAIARKPPPRPVPEGESD
jgi:2-polyprenyl-3-methyl-5-hydroxy-6-metoxy-1,4-benzoquinol methylase